MKSCPVGMEPPPPPGRAASQTFRDVLPDQRDRAEREPVAHQDLERVVVLAGQLALRHDGDGGLFGHDAVEDGARYHRPEQAVEEERVIPPRVGPPYPTSRLSGSR